MVCTSDSCNYVCFVYLIGDIFGSFHYSYSISCGKFSFTSFSFLFFHCRLV